MKIGSKFVLSCFLSFLLFVPFLSFAKEACRVDSPCPEEEKEQDRQTQGEICVYYFYTPGCPYCKKVSDQLNILSKKYNLDLKSIDAKNNPQKFRAFLKTYNVPFKDWGKVPIVFIGDKYLLGDRDCCEKMESVIQEVKSQNKTQCPDIDFYLSEKVSFYLISFLAVADSINPCALTIFLLLLIILIEQKKFSGKKTFISALAFIFAVFISYAFLGGLIVSGFNGIASLNLSFTFWVYKIVGILAIVLGTYNIIEFLRSKPGTCKVQPLFGLKMQAVLHRAFSPLGMFVAGLLISVFLLPCSSGPYFVAGGILMSRPFLEVVLWLLYYNLIIVLPMLAIACLISFALVRTEKVSNFVSKNSRYFSLVIGVILIALGIWTLTI